MYYKHCLVIIAIHSVILKSKMELIYFWGLTGWFNFILREVCKCFWSNGTLIVSIYKYPYSLKYSVKYFFSPN